jgi:hypothetical protein
MIRWIALPIALLLGSMTVMGAGAKHGSMAVPLHSVGGSGVSGTVRLVQLPHDRGTHIFLRAVGLQSGHRYRSLYYHNSTCALEPYATSDVIGEYVANPRGMGHTSGKADDNLAAIGSVSVRDASQPFSPGNPGTLIACAVVQH